MTRDEARPAAGGDERTVGRAARPRDDDDPQGMRGQMDDSMTALEPDDDPDEAARGISQQET